MTTDRQMAMMYAAQEEVIAALRGIDEPDLAGRRERRATVRRERRCGDGWPFTCRSAACVWCRSPMIRSWWNSMRPLVSKSRDIERCHHPGAFAGRLT